VVDADGTSSDGVAVTVDDPVAVIRLDRPATLNALTYPMLGAFRRAVDAAAADRRVVGIVVTGTGRGFCSGLDASVLQQTVGAGSASMGSAPAPGRDEVPGLFSYLLAVPKPVIAAVNGVAAGGGLVLAALCDIRIAGPSASFTTIFSRRGLAAEHGTSWILPRLLGPGHALDLLWTSRRIDAAEAHRIGLVERLSEGDPVEAAVAYVRELADTVSPASLADAKPLVYAHLGTDYPEALFEIDAVTRAALDRPDAREGAAALIEKRAPRFERLGADG
jgi:enoyl-CoA hydratase/carnithine racemase